MRSGFSDSLKQRLQRFPPAASPQIELVAINADAVKKRSDEMNHADSLTGLTVFHDGGVQLNETASTAFDQSTIVGGQYITDLDRASPFTMAEILWGGSTSPQVELLSLTLRLAPNVSGGTQEVQQWVLQLFNEAESIAVPRSATDDYRALVPISPPFYKTAGTSEGDVVFSWAGNPIKPRPRSVVVPTGLRGGVAATTFVLLWAIKADGTAAGNVGWAVNNAASSFASGGSTLTTATMVQTNVNEIVAVPGSTWYRHTPLANKLPRLKAIWNTAGAATITFTTYPVVPGDEIENSDVETNLLGYEQVNGAPSTIVRNNAHALSGAWSVKVTTTNVDYSGVRAMRRLGPTFPYELFPAVAGKSYTLRWWVFGTGAGIGKTMVVGISWRDSIDTVLHNDECAPVTLGAGWQLLTVTATAVASTVYAALYLSQRPAQGVWDFWADDPHFAAVPVDTVEFTGTGETPAGSALAYAVQADDATWLPFVDGDTTDSLSAANPTHPIGKRIAYAVRATLTPSAAGDATPTLRTVGVRVLQRYDCTALASLEGGTVRVDPATLKPSIAEPRLVAIRDGGPDFRDLLSVVLSSFHIGQLSVRTFWGAPDLARSAWMPYETYFVDDYDETGGGVALVLLSPLVLLRGVLPPYNPNTGLRQPVTTLQNVTIAAAWAELIDGQLGLPGAYRGDGPTDTKTVSKIIPANVASPQARAGSLVAQLLDQQGWQTVQAKDQVDGLSFLAGGATIASQGRIKWVPIVVGDLITRPDGSFGYAITQIDAPRCVFHEGEVQWLQVGPGFSERVPEYYVPYNWNVAVQKFGFEHRAFNAPGLLNLGIGRVSSQPTVLDTDTAQWIVSDGGTALLPTSGLARRTGARQATLLGAGMLLWRFRSTYPHPELEAGDLVVVPTDRFVALNPISGTGIVGRFTANVVIVETEPGGRDFGVWVRQWSDLAPSVTDPINIVKDNDPGDDLAVNGDFEAGLAMWDGIQGYAPAAAADSTVPYKGTYALRFETGIASQQYVAQGSGKAPLRIRVQPGAVLRVRAAAKTDGTANTHAEVRIAVYNDAFAEVSVTTVLQWTAADTTYSEKEAIFAVPAGAFYINVRLFGEQYAGPPLNAAVWFDEIHCWRTKQATDLALAASTGANTPTLGTNFPGAHATTPAKWVKVQGDDGVTYLVPAWPQ